VWRAFAGVDLEGYQFSKIGGEANRLCRLRLDDDWSERLWKTRLDVTNDENLKQCSSVGWFAARLKVVPFPVVVNARCREAGGSQSQLQRQKATDRSVRSTGAVSLQATAGSSPDFVRFGMTTLGTTIIE
jgi:hypothetical protein